VLVKLSESMQVDEGTKAKLQSRDGPRILQGPPLYDHCQKRIHHGVNRYAMTPQAIDDDSASRK